MDLVCPIEGLTFERRSVFADERGSVMHMLKASQTDRPIREVYFSTVKPGVTKGWKRHKIMWQRFAVPIGAIRFSFIDERPQSKSSGAVFSADISKENYYLVTVPPGIWYSFQCVSETEAMVVNAADTEHDPSESETKNLDQRPVAK